MVFRQKRKRQTIENNPHLYAAPQTSQQIGMFQWMGGQNYPVNTNHRVNQQQEMTNQQRVQQPGVAQQVRYTVQNVEPVTPPRKRAATNTNNVQVNGAPRPIVTQQRDTSIYYLKLKATEELKNFLSNKDDEIMLDDMWDELNKEFGCLDFSDAEALSYKHQGTLMKKAKCLKELQKVNDCLEPLMKELDAPTLGEMFSADNPSLYDVIYRRLNACIEMKIN